MKDVEFRFALENLKGQGKDFNRDNKAQFYEC